MNKCQWGIARTARECLNHKEHKAHEGRCSRSENGFVAFVRLVVRISLLQHGRHSSSSRLTSGTNENAELTGYRIPPAGALINPASASPTT